MIRLSLLTLYVLGFSIFAFRDWFKSLCALILLMAVIEHPDMPKSVLGVQGLNPWNVLLMAVLAGWLLNRRREGLRFDPPIHASVLVLLYFGVLMVSFGRMILDPWGPVEGLWEPLSYYWSNHLLNAMKWPIPALLLYDGARTRGRQALATFTIVGLYFLLAVQVIKWMPPEFALSGGDLSRRALKIVHNEIGYSRVSMSMLLAGGSWALLATLPLVSRWWHKAAIVLGFLAMCYAQALTGGRMGFVAWAVVGLVTGIVRYRRYLLLAPLAPLLIVQLAPGAMERFLVGFNRDADMEEESVDLDEVTSGRTVAWPLVIEMIGRSPWVGWGEEAMIRTGLTAELGAEGFPHPHNAYLELLLDTGWIGFLLVIPFYLVTLFHALRLFLSRHPPWVAGAGVAVSLMIAFLVAGFGSHSFYPRANTFGMWASIGLVYRLSRERARSRATRRAYAREQLSPAVSAWPGQGHPSTP